MSAGTLSDSPRVRNLLQACRRQIRTRFLLNGLGRFLTVAVFCTVTALFCDWLFNLPGPVRAVMLIACVGSSAAAIWRFLVQPMSQALPDQELGAAIDLSAPELEESLATLISIEDPKVSGSEAGSPLMRRHLESQISDRLASVRAEGFVDTRRTVQWCLAATMLVMLSLGTAAKFPGSSSVLLSRLLSPFGNHETATNLYFEVPDGDRVVAEGTDVVIAAIPRWRTSTPGERPDNVSLHLISEDERTESITMTYDEVSERFQVELSDVTDSVNFRIVGGGAVSQTYTMTVQPAPEILGAVLTVTPPNYTGRAVDIFDGMVGEMEVFERSTLSIRLDFNKPVESAALVWKRRDERPVDEVEQFNQQFDHLTGEAIELDPEDQDPDAPLKPEVEPLVDRVEAKLSQDGRSAMLNLVADVGGDLSLEVIDANGLQNLNEPDRILSVTYDTPPKLTVQGLHNGDAFKPDGIVAVNCEVTDDIGVGSLEMHYRIDNGVVRILPADGLEAGAQKVSHPFRLKLEELEVPSGTAVWIRIRATDERPVPRPHEVWSKEFNVRIDEEAAAQGSQAMSEESQKMVDSLSALADELQKDADKAADLAAKSEEQATQEVRDEARGLSEKEQQQGQALQRAAEEVGTHPLMKESADRLSELGNQLRNDIPNELDAAAREQNADADNLQQAEQQLREVRQALLDEIKNIEEQAQLEQNLAELGRLAVEADQLAKDAEELEEEREDPDSKPEELTDQEWQEQLDQKEQELARHQENLQRDLGNLLQEHEGLLDSARESQQRQMQDIASRAQELAEQQQQVADAVDQEAEEAGGQAADLADQVEQLQQDANDINKDAPENAQADPQDLNRLENAANELRDGNLESPQQDIEAARQSVEQLQQDLEDSNQEKAEKAGQVADKLEQIEQQINEMQQARQPQDAENPPQNQDNDGQEQQAPKSPTEQLVDRVNELAQQSREAADTINQPEGNQPEGNQPEGNQPEGNQPEGNQPEGNNPAGEQAEETADSAERASQQVQSGDFEQAAESLNEASEAAGEAAQQSPQGGQQQEEFNKLQEDLQQAAKQAETLQQDERAQAQARQSTQQDVAEQASQLAEDAADVAERMALPELQMPQQAQQAQQAAQSGTQAAQNSQNAQSQLGQAQLQDAGESGQQAAEDLDQLAQEAQQAAGQPQQSGIPQDIGENVANALQSLQNAADALQQGQPGEGQPEGQTGEGQPGQGQPGQGQPGQGQPGQGQPGQGQPGQGQPGQGQPGQGQPGQGQPGQGQPGQGQPGQGQPGQGQPGQGQPGQGQPGQGQPGQGQPGQGQPGQGQPGQGQPGQGQPSGQLSKAAEALANAARMSLPGEFNPGESANGESGEGDGRGNDSVWDGLIPKSTAAGPAGSRNWGKVNDELNSETNDRIGVRRDSEYDALIRMYFREVARAAAEEE